jgi:hypothetical protein
MGFFKALGVGKIIFSSDTSEEQYRTYGKGRITMDSCYPVKALAGHMGELLYKDINLLFVPPYLFSPFLPKGSCGRYPFLHQSYDERGEYKGGLFEGKG